MPRVLTACLLTLTLTACQTSVQPLAHTADSPEALARAVLAAATAGDRESLIDMALSEAEFRDHVWPDLPAARPERNLPFSYVWGDLRQKSAGSLASSVNALRGQPLTFEAVRFGDVTRYPEFTVHRDAVFIVRRPGGTAEELRVCGSFVEKRGRWKVFSYVTGD